MTFQPMMHVRVEFPHPGAERIQRRALIHTARGTIRHGAIAAIDDQHLVNVRRIQGNSEQAAVLALRFDIERQYTRFEINLGRPQLRIGIHPSNAVSRNPRAVDFAAALDAAIDQVAHREAYISLECIYPGCVQSVAQPRHILRNLELQLAYRIPCETAFADRLRFRRPQRASALGVGRADVEVRALPIVAHQECAAAFQQAMNVHHRPALPIRLGYNAITRLQNETTCRHARILRQCRGGGDIVAAAAYVAAAASDRHPSSRGAAPSQAFAGRS